MNKRVKEIDVWVHKDAIRDGSIQLLAERDNFKSAPALREYMPAKLIIELPERKVEITESEWMDHFYLMRAKLPTAARVIYDEAMSKEKEKLFRSET